ncbi:thaumatin family protein [Actinocorallia longicatena]|uniref:Thaumatin family protein n=1 Tax=Actinocorallia longicatena TaxID=111803 RepID=A0ABP6QJJ0_9ACTN
MGNGTVKARLLAVLVSVLAVLAGAPVPTAEAAPVPAGHRRIQVVNRLHQTIWVAATPSARYPTKRTGWVLKPGRKINIDVHKKWGGRIWGRTGCAFDKKGLGHCTTGDCGGRFQCRGGGATPATLAELALSAWKGMDFYDVSMVDGSNLPMYININHTKTKDPISAKGVYKGHKTRPVNCPKRMRVKGGACTTPCAAFGGDAYCCEGRWSGRDNCKPWKWPVDYTKVFKRAEPYAYSYAYDDSATMPCKGACYYRITFGITP